MSEETRAALERQLRLAEAWYRSGRLGPAIESYRSALTLDPGCWLAHQRSCELLRSAGRFDEAAAAHLRALEHFPNEAELHKGLLDAVCETDGIDRAFDHYGLVRVDEGEIAPAPDEVLCFVVVRNERLRLPYFLEYYRELGVRRFFAIDNDSNDGTGAYLEAEPDVHLWRSAMSFNRANFGSAWFQVLMRAYGVGHWCLTLDADELLVYPEIENDSLPAWCTKLDEEGKTAFDAVLLDMYSDRPIAETAYREGQDFREVCPFFDRRFFHESTENAGPYQNQRCYFGGVRQRVFGEEGAYYLSKVPLLKYDPSFVIAGGQHWTNRPPSEVSSASGCLLHFKFFSGFVGYVRDEIVRKEHYGDAMQYEAYAEGLGAAGELVLYDADESVRLEDSAQLERLGIIRRASPRSVAPQSDPPNRQAEDAEQPFWSVMITVHDRFETLGRAIDSVLAQDPGSGAMQIEVVHDPSDEDGARRVEEIVGAHGAGRVALHRPASRLGHPGIFNRCIERALGRWVHILHDDDWVKQGFYSALRSGIRSEPTVAAAFTRHVEVDDRGRHHWVSWLERETPGLVPDWLERIAVMCRLQFASIAVRRDVVRALGGFSSAAGSAFDWDLWKRIAVRHPFWFEPAVLACSYKGPAAETHGLVSNGRQIADARRSIELSRDDLPEERSQELTQRALEHYGRYALDLARAQLESKNLPAAVANLEEALECLRPADDEARRLASEAEPKLRLANAWRLRGKLDLAEARYREIVAAFPDFVPGRIELGNLLFRDGRAREALEHLRTARDGRPGDPHLGFLCDHIERCLASVERATPRTPAHELEDQPDGKIDLRNQKTFDCHRSGWNFALAALEPLHKSGAVLFDGFLEDNFAWKHRSAGPTPPEVLERMRKEGTFDQLASSEDKGITPYREPWVGFLHNPPAMPEWFHYQESPQRIFEKEIWKQSVESCQGLFALSEYHADWLRERTGLPVSALVYPTEIPERTFDFESFLENDEKRIVQIGWWLRRISAIYELPIAEDNALGWQKIRLVPHFFENADAYLRELMQEERRSEKTVVPTHFERNTTDLQHVGNDAYDELLSRNIAFVQLYDASANTVVVECLARATPLLINPLPAVVEYLGEDYPLYFADLEEAANKALDVVRLRETHAYLLECPTRAKLGADAFLAAFRESEVYRGLAS